VVEAVTVTRVKYLGELSDIIKPWDPQGVILHPLSYAH